MRASIAKGIIIIVEMIPEAVVKFIWYAKAIDTNKAVTLE
jgi:hypothetical protein